MKPGRNRVLMALLLATVLLAPAFPKPKIKTRSVLDATHLAAVHDARIEFMKRRLALPQLGVYQDFRAVIHRRNAAGVPSQAVLQAAQQDEAQIVLETGHSAGAWSGLSGGVLFLRSPKPDADAGAERDFLAHVNPSPAPGAINDPASAAYFRRTLGDAKQWKKLRGRMSQQPDEVYAAGAAVLPGFPGRWDREFAPGETSAAFNPYEVGFRHASIHILARELTESGVRAALSDGRDYVAEDWLCDPTGFAFVAVNRLGVFDMGDRTPMAGSTRIEVRLPLPAKISLVHNNRVLQEATGESLDFAASEEGWYRVEARLSVDGNDLPWIMSNCLNLVRPAPDSAQSPPGIDPAVAVFRNVTYIAGEPADANKHKLDVYIPKGVKHFPVLLFIHGGSWRSGDRALYSALGNRFARAGIGIVIPSYRLAPAHPPPAQIEDAASAFAWTARYIGKYGGDPDRLYVGGHSAGGHLAALLALVPKYLKRYDLSPANIKGVAALSGVYDVRSLGVFGHDAQFKRDASPLFHVLPSAPPFLITYCQWD
ncbi:MAG: alpha/beta hydrolase fold domain-containing protein, partial [Bryobacteraceae bacterium]